MLKNLFGVLFILLFVFSASTSTSEILSIKGDGVGLRSQPDAKSPIKWEYNNGFPVEIMKKKGDWAFVKDFENDTGWIQTSKLEKKPQVIVKANKNENNTVNIRSTPSSDSPVIANAYYGVVFSTLEKNKSWTQVRHENGVKGWIKNDFIWGAQ